MTIQYLPAQPSLVGDVERDLVCDQLANHHATGLLDKPEFERRMSVALQSRSRAELRQTLTGLPSPAIEVAPPRRSSLGAVEALVAAIAMLALFCLVGALWLAGVTNNDDVAVGLMLGAAGGGAVGMGLTHLVHRLRS